MLITVRHVTRYRYEEAATYSAQSLKLTPAGFATQKIMRWRIEAPNIDPAASFVDGFGNRCHLITVNEPHDELMIVARGEVEVTDASGIMARLPDLAPLRVYLRQTPYTEPDEAIRELAFAAAGNDELERLHDLMGRIKDAVAWEPGTTHAHTNAAEALAEGRGVCQDHAHIFISCARLLGIPARYITGYMVHDDEEPAEAHHAWAEARIPDLGWVGFDVANGICPNELHVRLSCGLDAKGAAPIRGARRGGTKETLDVEVEVQQQSVQQ